ncbi:MAG: DUF1634 domain-containing protein [Armatimonadetes bacterium]|nr:DUF1634 domain-containing protein [Armatimonadota bacterium]
METAISRLLQAGVALAALVVAVGAVIYLLHHANQKAAYSAFQSEPSHLRYVTSIIEYARDASGRGLIQLGLLILIATPIARVAFSAIAFAVQRDWLYVGITLVVLVLLAASLAGLV